MSGELYVITGTSCAGKTTLVDSLSCPILSYRVFNRMSWEGDFAKFKKLLIDRTRLVDWLRGKGKPLACGDPERMREAFKVAREVFPLLVVEARLVIFEPGFSVCKEETSGIFIPDVPLETLLERYYVKYPHKKGKAGVERSFVNEHQANMLAVDGDKCKLEPWDWIQSFLKQRTESILFK